MKAGHALKLAGLATFMILAAIAGYVYWNRVPPAAEGEVLSMRSYRPHAAPSLLTPAAVVASEPAEDQPDQPLIVLIPASIRNVGEKPLTVVDLTAVLHTGNAEYRSTDISAADFPRVFQFYPELADGQPQQQPMLRKTVIPPGGSLRGLLVFNYPVSPLEWTMRSSFTVAVAFDKGKDLVLSVPDETRPAPAKPLQARSDPTPGG